MGSQLIYGSPAFVENTTDGNGLHWYYAGAPDRSVGGNNNEDELSEFLPPGILAM